MNRTQLIDYTANWVVNRKATLYKEQVNYCQCWLLKRDFNTVTVVQSYSTYVAIFSHETGTLYVFDKYSNTTCQHIHKVAKMLNADRIVWLYRRRDNLIELDCHTGEGWKLTNADWNKVLECDFSSYIENKAFR